jgi:serine/threonine protein phosphatase PrpC
MVQGGNEMQPYFVVLGAAVLLAVLLAVRFRLSRRSVSLPPGGIEIGNGQTIGSRSEQDDYFASMTTPVGTLAVVADGISGLANGRMSSTLAVTTFTRAFAKLEDASNLNGYFAGAATQSNRGILQNLNGQGGGTTLAAVIICGYQLHYGAVGDSLITIYRNGHFKTVNSKHTAETLLEERVLAGQMTSEEAKTSPVRNQLVNYLGYEGFESMELGAAPIRLYSGDHVLLCSDGIHEALTEIELEEIMRKGGAPQEMADVMIEAINDKGFKSQDNATVIILALG